METDEVLGRYLLAAAEHFDSGNRLESKRQLDAHNRAADELRSLATEIGKRGTEAMIAFSRLLDEPRNGVNGWAAFHILEVMTAPPNVVDQAFETLELIARGDGIHALGIRMRLRELRAEFGRSESE